MGAEKIISVFSGKRVLVAEDNALNMEITTQMCLSMGVMVDQAMDGAQAVEKLMQADKDYYHMILLDIQMPVMNGYEATAKMLEIEKEKATEIPIIAITANASEEDRKKVVECGMAGLIEKPLEKDAVYKVLEKHFMK